MATSRQSRLSVTNIYKKLAGTFGQRSSVDQPSRNRSDRPTLVAAGRNVGDSRVQYRGHNLPLHLLTRDFFITIVNLNTWILVLLVALIYLSLYLFWSLVWWLVVKYDPGCLYGAETYVEAFAFSIVTQMTIGYGNTGPQACWEATWLIAIQSIIGLLVEAITIGIVFARISHPAQRGKSIFISNKAVIARRDGTLKFMFRVADIRSTQVVEPKVKAYLYTWGEGRITAEGERIPVRVEPLEVDYIDGMLMLPLIIEHTIDERSPLCGHTLTSLLAMNSEVVVTFEGTTEMGNPFMSRRSYVPTEIYWGHQFVSILQIPDSTDTHYVVNLERFHDVELQGEMPVLLATQLSQLVVNRAKRTVPYPLLGENTLVLSDLLCVAPNENGQLTLRCRVGDTYPNQMLEMTVRMYLYRWKDMVIGEEPTSEGYEQIQLSCGYEHGNDRLYLRLPVEVEHIIDENSPLAAWQDTSGLDADLQSEIVVVINGYLHVSGQNRLRQRTYAIDHHLRYGYKFRPIVKPPKLASDRKPRVRWQHFHEVIPADDMTDRRWGRNALAEQSTGPLGSVLGDGARLSIAPESHAYLRSVASMQQRSRPGLISMPSVAALELLTNEERNDLTMIPMDLQRYAAAVGGGAEVTSAPQSPTVATAQEAGDFSSVVPTRGSGRTTTDSAGGTSAVPESVFTLFPQLAKYEAETYDAGDSLPHAAALHPSLPGPDRFRLSEDDERNDYTVVPMDLSRYTASISQSDTLPLRKPKSAYQALPAEFTAASSAATAADASPSRLGGGDGPASPTSSVTSALPDPSHTNRNNTATSSITPAGAGGYLREPSPSSIPEQDYELGEEGAGPIHIRQVGSSWAQGRALKNLFGGEGDGDDTNPSEGREAGTSSSADAGREGGPSISN